MLRLSESRCGPKSTEACPESDVHSTQYILMYFMYVCIQFVYMIKGPQ